MSTPNDDDSEELFPYFEEMHGPKTLSTAQILKRDMKLLMQFTKDEGGVLYPSQAAYALGVSAQAVDDLMKRGKLPALKVFGRRVVSASAVIERLENKPQAGRPRILAAA